MIKKGILTARFVSQLKKRPVTMYWFEEKLDQKEKKLKKYLDSLSGQPDESGSQPR